MKNTHHTSVKPQVEREHVLREVNIDGTLVYRPTAWDITTGEGGVGGASCENPIDPPVAFERWRTVSTRFERLNM